MSAELDRVTYRVPSFHNRAEPDEAGDRVNPVSGDAEVGVTGATSHQHNQHGKNYHHTHGQYCDVLPQTDGERILIKVYIWSIYA
jgi:hypothetical protein